MRELTWLPQKAREIIASLLVVSHLLLRTGDQRRRGEANRAPGSLSVRQIVNRNHRLFVCGIDAIDTVVHSLLGMLGEKALGCHAREASPRAQRTANDLREYPAGDAA